MGLRRLAEVLATLVLIVLAGASEAYAQGDPVENATDQAKAEARQRYLEGKRAFAQRKLEDALQGFRGSYEVVASPNSHLMVVNTLVEMERYDQAYTEAQAVAAEADAAVAAGHGKYGTTAAAARRTMEWLRPQIGLVTVEVSGAEPGAVVTVKGRAIDSAQWGKPVPVLPGPTTVLLSSTSGEQRRELTVQPGGTDTVVFRPPEPEPAPPTLGPAEPEPGVGMSFNPLDGAEDQRLTAYIVGGVGATGMVLFAILGGLHLSQYGDLEDQCTEGVCPAALEEDADRGRSYQTGANVSLVIGLVGLAGGAALFFTTDWFLGGDENSAEQAWRPRLTVGPGSVGLRGVF